MFNFYSRCNVFTKTIDSLMLLGIGRRKVANYYERNHENRFDQYSSVLERKTSNKCFIDFEILNLIKWQIGYLFIGS